MQCSLLPACWPPCSLAATGYAIPGGGQPRGRAHPAACGHGVSCPAATGQAGHISENGTAQRLSPAPFACPRLPALPAIPASRQFPAPRTFCISRRPAFPAPPGAFCRSGRSVLLPAARLFPPPGSSRLSFFRPAPRPALPVSRVPCPTAGKAFPARCLPPVSRPAFSCLPGGVPRPGLFAPFVPPLRFPRPRFSGGRAGKTGKKGGDGLAVARGT